MCAQDPDTRFCGWLQPCCSTSALHLCVITLSLVWDSLLSLQDTPHLESPREVHCSQGRWGVPIPKYQSKYIKLFCGLKCVRQALEDSAYLEFPKRGVWGPLSQKNNCAFQRICSDLQNWDYCCGQGGSYESQARVFLFRVCSVLRFFSVFQRRDTELASQVCQWLWGKGC